MKWKEVSIVKCCGKVKSGMSHWLRQAGGDIGGLSGAAVSPSMAVMCCG